MKSFEGYLKKKLGDSYILLAGGSHKTLSDFSMSGHNHNDLYISSLTTSGNYLRWVKNGSNNDITVPYATSSNLASNADTVDSIHATGFLRWKGMLNIGNHAPFQAVVDIIKDTTKLNDGGLAMYSYAGDEYTVLIGSRNDATRHGNALKWGYGNRYLWLLRMISGNPLSTDWEKIYAGYADSAGSATYASSYLANRQSIGTSSQNHAEALKSYFDSYKSTIPRNCLTANYSSSYGNGSLYIGYFLSGYDSAPYGGFYVCHYGTPYYVGISNGSYSNQQIITSSSIGSQSVNYASSAGSVAWGNVTGKPSLIVNSGDLSACPDGTAITNPGGANAVTIRTPVTSGRDIGILRISDDNAYICNSSDNVYTFGVFDTDLTLNFASTDTASFCVLSEGAGCKIRGNTVIHTGNYTSYCAASSHSHSYVPLSGGTMTGDLSTTGVSASGSSNRLIFRHLDGQNCSGNYDLYLQYYTGARVYFGGSSYYIDSGGNFNGTASYLNSPYNTLLLQLRNDAYKTVISYRTYGNEALVFAAKQSVTSYMFFNGIDLAAGSNWHDLGNPALQIKQNCVYVNLLIGLDVSPSYNFYVNGTAMISSNLYVGNRNTRTGIFNLGAGGNTPSGYTTTSAGGNQILGLISWDGSSDEGGILVGSDCCIIYNSSDSGYLFKVVDKDVGAALGNGFGESNVRFAITDSGECKMISNCYAANFYTTSDIRKKDNIKSISNLLPIYEFNWKSDGSKSYGFIAQWLEETNPELVSGEDYKHVNYNATLALYLAKLSNVVEDDKAKIARLEARVKELERRIV